jgi:hypothetical protein
MTSPSPDLYPSPDVFPAPTGPEYTPLGQRLAERCRPMQSEEVDAANGYAYGNLCEAMMRPFQQVGELVDPPDPYAPWVPLFYVDITPDWALRWLGQVVGVRVPATASPAQARQMIKDLAYTKIGQPDTIMNAAKSTLTGTQTVHFREREDGDAYKLEITTLESETPDPGLTEQRIQAQVPAGILLHYFTVSNWIYEEVREEGWTYDEMPGIFATYRDYRDNNRTGG